MLDVPFYATTADAASALSENKTEGDGFDSPEDAVKAYLLCMSKALRLCNNKQIALFSTGGGLKDFTSQIQP